MEGHNSATARHITILGGGIAGLAMGYCAKKKGLPFTIYEAHEKIGGNCVTYSHGDFLYDSGAHRFLDRDPEITEEVKALLGDELTTIEIPSKIYDNGKFIEFPLKPRHLLSHLGLVTFARAGLEALWQRLKVKQEAGTFEAFALKTYGRTIASRFLLNYSEKLWGRPTSLLSPVISGKRLQGLSLWNLIKETFLGGRGQHLEGLFYYPRGGINTIARMVAEFCGSENIYCNSRISGILHNKKRIIAIEVNEKEKIEVDEVVSSLPLDYFIKHMQPAAPEEILEPAGQLCYRDVRLVCLFLNKESLLRAATLYFPDRKFSFTRLYEPRNRNADMAPPGKTSIVAEIPCEPGNELGTMDDRVLMEKIGSQITGTGLVQKSEIIEMTTKRVPLAYPLFLAGYEEKVGALKGYLQTFENLKLTGRNGRFEYLWMHNMFRFGLKIVDDYLSQKQD